MCGLLFIMALIGIYQGLLPLVNWIWKKQNEEALKDKPIRYSNSYYNNLNIQARLKETIK